MDASATPQGDGKPQGDRQVRVLPGVALLTGTSGYLLLGFVGSVGGMPVLMAGFVFIGVGTFGALGTNLVVGSVPPARAGSAAAFPPSAVTWATRSGWPRSEASAPPSTEAGASMENAVVIAQGLSAQAADGLMAAAGEAYISGLNVIGIACAVVTAVIAFTVLRERRQKG